MRLFNKTIDRQLFKQYALGSDLEKQDAVVKIFNPFGRGTWFILNSDPEDPDYLWAIVDLGYGAEIGSVSRSELENYRGKFGLGFERDLSFDPINAEELYKGLRVGKYFSEGGGIQEKNKVKNIDLLTYDGSVFAKNLKSFKEANEVMYFVWKSGKYSDVRYKLEYLDGNFLKGIIDIEPKEFHAPHKDNILSWHLKTYWNNVANTTKPYIPKDYVQEAKELVDNYAFDDDGKSSFADGGSLTHSKYNNMVEFKAVPSKNYGGKNSLEILNKRNSSGYVVTDSRLEFGNIDAGMAKSFFNKNFENGGQIEVVYERRADFKNKPIKLLLLNKGKEQKGFTFSGKDQVAVLDNYNRNKQEDLEKLWNLKGYESKYADGGDIENFSDNQRMIMNQNVEVEHHHEELEDILEDEVPVPAWVVAKMETATQNLSDITHYLDGQKEITEEQLEEDDDDDDNEEEVENKEVVEPINVSAGTKAELTKKFTDDAWGNLRGFLKGMEGIDLRDDYTFDYKDEQFEVEPIINSDENGVSNAVFTIFDGDGEEVGEVAYSREGGKQKFTANSDYFQWNNAKFEDGGFMNSIYADGGSTALDNLNKNIEEREKMISYIVNMKSTSGMSDRQYDALQKRISDKSFVQLKKEYDALKGNSSFEDGGYFDGAIPNVSSYMSTYAKGGEVAKAEILGLKKNILGTTDVEMKITGMRKPQRFSVYPIGKDDLDKIITIQSETRIGKIDLSTGRGLMSQSHSNGAYFVHLQMDKLTPFTLSESDLEELKMHIFRTAGDNVGSRGIFSDNSGASSVYADGGGIGFIPMDLEENLRITAKWGGTDIKGVIGILNAMIDSGLTDEDLKSKPTKSGTAHQNAIEKRTNEIWAKIEPEYKGDLKGNMPYSTIRRLVDRANSSDDILKRFKPFRKNQKDSFADGGFMNDVYAKGGNLKKYILKADIKTVTVKRNGKEVTYKGADVLNGAHVLAKGGDITSKANYVGKNDIVEVELKDGSKVKPANGYWIKKGAEPIGAEPTPTSSSAKETKVGETYIRKDARGNWRAETNIDNFNNYDWRISTIKTYSGKLISSAQGGKTESTGSKGIVMFKYTMYEDPNYTLEVSSPKRLTDKVVSEQHDKALAKFKKFMETGMFKRGGKISNFDKLSAKVAKEYEGKPVKSKYQEEYGKYYSKAEAQEVGDKVAGKVKAMQSDKKAFGGFFGGAKKLVTSSKKYPDLSGKQVILKSGKYVQVFEQNGDKINVLELNNLGTSERPHYINISEVDMDSFKAGGSIANKRTNNGIETLKRANALAKKIRKDGESWLDAKKRAFSQLKK